MEAAAHGHSTLGIPAKVGKEFAAADKGSPKSRSEHIARQAKHKTQREVAKDFGTSQPTVSRTMRRGFNSMGSARD